MKGMTDAMQTETIVEATRRHGVCTFFFSCFFFSFLFFIFQLLGPSRWYQNRRRPVNKCHFLACCKLYQQNREKGGISRHRTAIFIKNTKTKKKEISFLEPRPSPSSSSAPPSSINRTFGLNSSKHVPLRKLL